jgi:hypothetical protein
LGGTAERQRIETLLADKYIITNSLVFLLIKLFFLKEKFGYIGVCLYGVSLHHPARPLSYAFNRSTDGRRRI